jgi:hypothetical protein
MISVVHDSVRRVFEPDLYSVSTGRVKTLYIVLVPCLIEPAQTRVLYINFTFKVVQTFAVYKPLKCCDNAHASVRRQVSKSMGIQCSGHARPGRGIPGAVMPATGWIGRYIRTLGLACDIILSDFHTVGRLNLHFLDSARGPPPNIHRPRTSTRSA